MKFTYTEWTAIRHAMRLAAEEFEKQMNTCKPSEETTSLYQIFKRQTEEMNELINRLDSTIL